MTNPLRGGEKKVRLISTPNGKSGPGARFYKIMTGAGYQVVPPYRDHL